ncbi:MAG: hypothetical protein IT577_05310 [Verrucomicrobiae bacterium]|nr:hypothetical protein [Verrucomicrobiae bacterium]
MKREVVLITIAVGLSALHQDPTPLLAATNEPPSFGSARMVEDGTLWLKLRAKSGDGAIGDALISYPPDHPRYTNILRHIGGIQPGQEKPVPPWPDDAESPAPEPDPETGFARAREVPVNREVEVRLAPGQSQDWLKLRIERHGSLELVMDWDAIRRNTNRVPFMPTATVFNAEQKEVGRLDILTRLETGAGVLKVSPGTFFVLVENHLKTPIAAAAAAASIGVTLQFTPEEDPSEPNDDFDHARPVEINTPIPVTLYPPGDQDYCVLNIQSVGFLDVTIKGTGGMREAIVYDANRSRIGYFSDAPQPLHRNTVRVRPGKIYVAFRRSDSWGHSREPFEARFEFTHEMDAAEPNDNFEHAQEIRPDASISFSLFPPGDKDFFRIQIPRPGHLSVTVGKGEIILSDPMATIYDGAQKEIAQLHPLLDFARTDESGIRVQPGTLYVMISARRPVPFLTKEEPTTAKFRFTPDDDPMEPNDSFAQAREAKPGPPLKVILWPPGDRDYFKIPVGKAASLYVTQARPAEGPIDRPVPFLPGPGVRMQLYDGEQNPIGESRPDWVARVTPPAAYLAIELPKAWRAAQEQQRPVNLTLNLELVEDDDPTEPNDDAEHAVAAHFGAPINVVFGSPADHDFFRLDVPAPGIIHAVTVDELGQERQEPTDLGGITFYDAESRKLRQSVYRDRQVRAGPGPVFADIRAPQPRRDGHRGGILRRVLFSLHPETDPTEPANDNRDGARAIRLGEPFTFRITPDYDTDWFAFRLEAADQLRWLVSGPTDGLRLSVELHDRNGQAIGNLGERPLVVSEPGPYSLRIRHAGLRGGTPNPLTGVLATDRSWRESDNTSPARARDLALNQVMILPASPAEKTYYFLLYLRTARHTALRTTWPEGSGELQTSLGGTLPLQPNAILSLAGGNHALAVTIKGQGMASLRMEDMEHHLPPELQYLLNRDRAAQAAETQIAPPPPPRLVTRDWIFDVRRNHETP